MLWSILWSKAGIAVEFFVLGYFSRFTVQKFWGKKIQPAIDKGVDKAEKVIGDNFGARL